MSKSLSYGDFKKCGGFKKCLALSQPAATALALQLPLYTRNPQDFEGLEHLIKVRAL